MNETATHQKEQVLQSLSLIKYFNGLLEAKLLLNHKNQFKAIVNTVTGNTLLRKLFSSLKKANLR